jgi:hypothetical protein
MTSPIKMVFFSPNAKEGKANQNMLSHYKNWDKSFYAQQGCM